MNPMPQEQMLSTKEQIISEKQETFFNKPDDLFVRDLELKLDTTVISTDYLLGDQLICLGCQDGVTRVLSMVSKKIQYNLCKYDKSPVAGIACCPKNSGIKNAVMIAHTEGNLEYWHATSQQLLFEKKFTSFIQSCEISNNGEWYVVSQENGEIHLGHLNKGNPTTLDTGHLGSHTNRVFCLKWNPNDENIFLSGGWDRAVFFWDIRVKTSVNKRFGYFIGGQAIDFRGNEVLLGNNESENQIRIYDQVADKVRQVPWQRYSQASMQSQTGVNSCFFGKQKGQILALSSKNQLRLLNNQRCASLLLNQNQNSKGYSMSHSYDNRQVVITWNDGSLQLLTY